MITPASEDYLKAIYSLQGELPATTNGIAHFMNVSPSSVTKMLKRLSDSGLVEYVSHRGVRLTEEGKKLTLSIIRRHRILELFLQKVLNYTWDEVHNEACKMEHCISEKFEDTIFSILGEPHFNPHGDPIPTKEGIIPELKTVPLINVGPNTKVEVKRIQNKNPEFLRYLSKIGISPNVEMTINDVQPFGGTIEININKEKNVIGVEAAENIFVIVKN